jgi:hypothetical protein
MLNFAEFGTATKAAKPAAKVKSRPVREIRGAGKDMALEVAIGAAIDAIMRTEGLATESGHYELDQSDRVFLIRVAYNAIFGPEKTVDNDIAQKIYESVFAKMQAETESDAA